MKCTFCGHAFDPGSAKHGCGGCFFDKGCDWVKCPACGYELVPEGQHKESAAAPAPSETKVDEFSLAHMTVGQRAVIRRIDTEDRLALRKMIAMGLLPETKVQLIQKYPAYVFGVGFDRFTIDQELAARIFLQKES